MRIKRWIAEILCMMIGLTLLPAGVVFAGSTDSITGGGDLGNVTISPTTLAVNGGAVHDFSAYTSDTLPSGVTVDYGTAEFGTEGVALSNTILRYCRGKGLSSFDFGDMLYLKVKATEGNSLAIIIYAQHSGAHAITTATLSASALTLQGATQQAAFTPGTGWVELILKRDASTHDQVWYARGGSLSEWTKLAEVDAASGWTVNASKAYNGLTFSGYGSIYSCATVGVVDNSADQEETPDPYDENATDADSYQTVEGKFPWFSSEWTKFLTNRLVFDENFETENDLTKLGITYQEDIPGYDFGDIAYESNGLTMIPSTTGLAGSWIWKNGKSAWAPLEPNNTMIRFRAKMKSGGVLGFQTQVVGATGKIMLNIYASGQSWLGCSGTSVMTDTYKNGVGTGWMDYLVTSDGTNYSLYAKKVDEPYWNLVGTSGGFYGTVANNVLQLNSNTEGTFVKSVEVLTPDTALIDQVKAEAQRTEFKQVVETAKETTVAYDEIAGYNPTIEKYAHIKAITYDGYDYKDQKTKVFAYLGFPENASAEEPVPAVVLIHGGGGHPYLEWVRLWNERGYAAIAMETTGHFPKMVNAGIDESHNSDYAYEFGDFAEEGYILAPKCGNTTVYTELENQWNYHALLDIILATNILRQDNRVEEEKIGVTGVSWGGTLTSQIVGLDNRYAFAIPIYGTAYLNDEMCTFENYGSSYVSTLWGAEHNLSNATMPIMWYVWNDDGAFGMPNYMKSYNHTRPLNDKTILFVRDNWGHSHGNVFRENDTENHSKIFADWALNNRGGYPTFTEQPQGRTFNAKIDIPEDVTGEIKATLYYITESMTYSVHNKFGYSTQNYLDQSWKKTTAGITVDRTTGTVSGLIPESAAGYYINVEFTVDGVDCESSSRYVPISCLKVSDINTDSNLSFVVECVQDGETESNLYAALYDRNDVLIAIKKLDVIEKQTVTFTATGYDKIKVFWWDENSKPIAHAVEK